MFNEKTNYENLFRELCNKSVIQLEKLEPFYFMFCDTYCYVF